MLFAEMCMGNSRIFFVFNFQEQILRVLGESRNSNVLNAEAESGTSEN